MNLEELMKNWGLTIACGLVMIIWFQKNKGEFYRKIKKNPFEEYDEPGTATGLGILGTFVGITVGLFFFNTRDVINSVPALLSGMQTAFVPSIIGMAMNFRLKWKQHKAQDDYYKNVKAQPRPANIATLIDYLKKREEENEARMSHLMGFLRETNESLGDNLTSSIQEMTNSIVGNGEHTLNSELQRGFERTCDTLDAFQTNYLKQQTKQFTVAMNLVVKNFNKNLEEQCGENFKKFNQAIFELTKWQQDYMDKLKAVGDQQTEFVGKLTEIHNALTSVGNAVADLGSKTMDLQKVSDLAKQDYETIQQTMDEVLNSTEAFKKVVSVFEEIKQNMNESSKQLQQLNQTQSDAIKHELDVMQQEMKAAAQSLSDMNEKQQSDITEMLEKEVKDLCDILRQYNGNVVDTLNRDLLKSAQDTNTRICEISAKMTDDLNTRVNESLQSLGSALAQISEKFVADYTPLAEKLEEVVLLANKLQLSQKEGNQKE
mgnify:FL=1